MYNELGSTITSGIWTTKKPASKEMSRFDVLMLEQSENWKNKFISKLKNLYERQRISKNHIVSSKLKDPLCSIQEKGKKNQFIYKER